MNWRQEDRAKMIAYGMEKAAVCNMCGTAEWQWEGDDNAFEAIASICRGCQRRDWMREDNSELSGQAGVSLTLVPRALAQHIKETPSRRPRRRRRTEEDE